MKRNNNRNKVVPDDSKSGRTLTQRTSTANVPGAHAIRALDGADYDSSSMPEMLSHMKPGDTVYMDSAVANVPGSSAHVISKNPTAMQASYVQDMQTTSYARSTVKPYATPTGDVPLHKKTNTQPLSMAASHSAVATGDGGHAEVNHIYPQGEPPKTFSTLPSPNTYFQGRKKLFDEIKQKFSKKTPNSNQPNLIVLYGPGGAGKTSVAYQFAENQQTIPIKIRIRMESIGTITEDFEALANLIHIPTVGKTLDNIIKEVNTRLVNEYKGGIIIFDNVHCYNNVHSNNGIVNSIKEEPLAKFFPKGGNFWILATTRNIKFWPNDSKIAIPGLEEQAAITLFKSIANLPSIDDKKLSNLLLEVLGGSPLAICQAASYVKRTQDLDGYIKLLENPPELIPVLRSHSHLAADLFFHGETEIIRRAIFTTYDLNIQAIKAVDQSFLSVLRYAALMHPDEIGRKTLYGAYETKDASFTKGKAQMEFEPEIEKMSLLLFEGIDKIVMHRIIQLVFLLKIHDKKKKIKNILLGLLAYFSKNSQEKISYENCSYILNNIITKRPFYDCLEPSDPEVREYLLQVATSYIAANRNNEAIFFLSDIIKNIKENLESPLYDEAKSKLLEILAGDNFNIEHISRAWLKDLLQNTDKTLRKEIVATLFKKAKEFKSTEPDKTYKEQFPGSNLSRELFLRKISVYEQAREKYYQDMEEYFDVFINFSNVIIDVYEEMSNKSYADFTSLINAYNLLSDTFNKSADCKSCRVKENHNDIKGKHERRGKIQARTEYAQKIRDEISGEIEALRRETNELIEEINSDHENATDARKKSDDLKELRGNKKHTASVSRANQSDKMISYPHPFPGLSFPPPKTSSSLKRVHENEEGKSNKERLIKKHKSK